MRSLRTLSLGVTASALVASALAVPAFATDTRQDAPSNQLAVEVVTVNGSGCPAGSTDVDMSADNGTVSLRFNQLLASHGPATSGPAGRKNCQIAMRLDGVPDGYSYAVVSAEYRGYAKIAPGAKGQHAARYYFQGSPANQDLTTTFDSGYDDEFTIVDTVDASKAVWSPCGKPQRNLNANISLLVTGAKKDTSFVAQDSAHLSAGSFYKLAWKRC